MSRPDKTQIGEVEAKGGRRVKGMPIVLGVSTLVAIGLIFIVFGLFAA